MPENIEKKFKDLMRRQGMENLVKSDVFIAQIGYPDPEHPTVLGEFKTKEERDRWYKEQGHVWEDAAGKKMEFLEQLEE